MRRAKKKWNFDDSATELSLRRGTVSAIDASLISAVLLSPALALVKLDLRTSQMGAREVASVANGLAKNNTLTFLNLSGNALSDGAIVSGEYEQAKLPPNGGLAALGACLRVNTALQKLDLSENRIEAKGLAALSRGLKDNVGLTELNAKNNTVVSISKCAWGDLRRDRHYRACRGAQVQQYADNDQPRSEPALRLDGAGKGPL